MLCKAEWGKDLNPGEQNVLYYVISLSSLHWLGESIEIITETPVMTAFYFDLW